MNKNEAKTLVKFVKTIDRLLRIEGEVTESLVRGRGIISYGLGERAEKARIAYSTAADRIMEMCNEASP